MSKSPIKLAKFGNVTRFSYAKKENIMELPDLLEMQKDSYKWFVEVGLREVLDDISPIIDFNGNLILEFLDYELSKEAKYDEEECKERDATYSAPLKLKVRLINKETQEIKEQEVFVGNMPIMTKSGSFIINGAERVVVSQLVRSPGIYYGIDYDKTGKPLISCTLMPNRGAWVEYETDSKDVFYVRVDRTRKIPVTCLIRAIGVSSDEQILELFGEDPKILATIEKDVSKNYEEAMIEIYKKLRPGEPPTLDSAENLFNNMMFDDRRYDLSKVGRYKFNKKLSFANRIFGRELARDVIDEETGEILYKAKTKLSKEDADNIQDAGIHILYINAEGKEYKIIGNSMVDINKYTGRDFSKLDIHERVYLPVLKELMETATSEEDLKKIVKKNMKKLLPKNVTIDDLLASVNYALNIEYGIGSADDIDHLGNRRIKCVGELLQNQFRIGLTRMEKVVRERMNLQNVDMITPQVLMNTRPVISAIKEFFGTSQLSQFMQQDNPLDELTHKRKLSALGPGGLSRERAGFEVRDVHYTHFGRMCPIETPEGPNIGLINSLSAYSRVNEYGFLETPYRIVNKTGKEPIVTDECRYFTADEEELYNVAQANEPLDEKGRFVNKKVTGRHKDDIIEVEKQEIDLMEVSPLQMVSIATGMIPFLENDDANRALMGSNMQRQSVPLLKPAAAVVGTGIEYKAATNSGIVIIAERAGTVKKVEADQIVIETSKGELDTYRLRKYKRSNTTTCINQRCIVDIGQKVKVGEIIADGPSTRNGEMALGKNPLIAFMTWEGYNYEDAILVSERLVQDDVFTSIHIEEYEIQSRDTKLGPEDITRDIPNIGDDAVKDLGEDGIIRVGAKVGPGDILVGKVTPKGETELTAEERLLRAIFGEKSREVRDTSLRMPHGEGGIVHDVKIYTRKNSDELPPGVNQVVRVYIAQKRKLSVGDKMAGRHGNKGVVSRVLPVEDMPYLPNGRPVDIVLNPLGVPSRMNIGQVLEVHLGLAAEVLGVKVSTPVFNGADEDDVKYTLKLADDYANLEWKDFEKKWKKELDPDVYTYLEKNKQKRNEWKDVPIGQDGKILLKDGRTGEFFDNPVTVGFMNYLKLHHLVDDKMHARSTGPYSLVTQQPLGGKAQFGGQRFGEMEVWALESYGAAYTLREVLTVKSDDVVGRVKTYESIVKGNPIPKAGIPESFKVFVKELQSLGLDVIVQSTSTGEETHLNETLEGDESPDVALLANEEKVIEEDIAGMTIKYIDDDGALDSDIATADFYGDDTTE